MKKKLLTAFIAFVNMLPAIAQKITQPEYVAKFKNIAIIEQRRSGVPAAITLAQGVLESESGNSYLAKEGRNHFGIKCKLEWAGGKVYRDDDERNECFRQYNTDRESYADHSDFLKLRPYYAACFNIAVTDYTAWAKCLKNSGYATEKNYPEMLIGLIEKLNLNQYTIAALDNNYIVTDVAPNQVSQTVAVVNNNNKTNVEGETKKTVVTNSIIINNTAPKKVGIIGNPIKINGVKAIMVYAETPLLLIAQKYDVPLAKLKAHNDLINADIVPFNQPIFLKAKKTWHSQKKYIVKPNETIYFISQKMGIEMFKLLAYNNLVATATIQAGDELLLDNVAKKNIKEKINRLLGK